MQIDDALVDAHLEAIPGLGSLSARSLPGGDAQGLGGHAHGTLGLEVLVLGALDQVVADLLQALHVQGGERDADAVDRGLVGGAALLVLVSSRLKGEKGGETSERNPAKSGASGTK